MAKHLEGKTAIVTGGAGGIGSWISKLYAENGAKVIVADTGADVEGRMGMDASRVNAVVDEITAAGGEAVAAVGDVSEMDVAEGLVRTALERWGKLDILCCAHGILRERMIFNMTEDEWDGSIKSHLKGCFAPTKFAAIHWRQERQGGRIIYFTSDAGIRGSSGQPNYSAAARGQARPDALERARPEPLRRDQQLHRAGRLDTHDRPRPGTAGRGPAAQRFRSGDGRRSQERGADRGVAGLGRGLGGETDRPSARAGTSSRSTANRSGNACCASTTHSLTSTNCSISGRRRWGRSPSRGRRLGPERRAARRTGRRSSRSSTATRHRWTQRTTSVSGPASATTPSCTTARRLRPTRRRRTPRACSRATPRRSTCWGTTRLRSTATGPPRAPTCRQAMSAPRARSGSWAARTSTASSGAGGEWKIVERRLEGKWSEERTISA